MSDIIKNAIPWGSLPDEILTYIFVFLPVKIHNHLCLSLKSMEITNQKPNFHFHLSPPLPQQKPKPKPPLHRPLLRESERILHIA